MEERGSAGWKKLGGSVGHVFVGRCVPTFAEFLAENTPKDGRYYLILYTKIDFHVFDSPNLHPSFFFASEC